MFAIEEPISALAVSPITSEDEVSVLFMVHSWLAYALPHDLNPAQPELCDLCDLH